MQYQPRKQGPPHPRRDAAVFVRVGIDRNLARMHVLFFCNLEDKQSPNNYTSWDWSLIEMHVLFFGSDYINTRQSQSNYTSWDWNLAEMHLLFFYNWRTESAYNTRQSHE